MKDVVSFDSMFMNCYSLTSVDLSKFASDRLTTMKSMFENCGKLTSLNLSHFDTHNVNDMSYAFYNCSSLALSAMSGLRPAIRLPSIEGG